MTAHEQWQRTQAELLESEKRFGDMSVQHALGGVSAEELDRFHRDLLWLRTTADGVFKKAFGVERRSAPPPLRQP